MYKWYNRAWLHILEELQVNKEKGINENEVQSRKSKFGDNRILVEKKENIIKVLIGKILTPAIIYVLLSMIASFYRDKYIMMIIDLIFIIVAIVIFYMNYKKTYEFIDEMNVLNNIDAKVIRNYSTKIIKSSELVVGDIVYLSRDSVVPADIRILECERLKVDEYLVTGEKESSTKYSTKIEEKDISLNLIKNMLFMGSKVVTGEATGVVVAVGDKTQIGKIISFIKVNNSGNTVLKNSITKYLNKMIVYIASALMIGLIFNYLFYTNFKFAMDMFMDALILSYPMWFFIVLTLVIFYEIKSLRNKGIHLNSLETLNKIPTIQGIFMNKVGALSKEEFEVKKIYTNSDYVSLYNKDILQNINVCRLIDIAYLTATSKLNNIDIAINDFVEKNKFNENIDNQSIKKIFDIPYDSNKRIKTTVNKIENFYRAHVVGDVDAILENCIHIMKDGFEAELTRDEINNIKNAHIKMSNIGLRVVALSYRNFGYEPSIKENVESNLVLVGLLAVKSEINKYAKEDIAYCRSNGILPIIFTDDDKLSCIHTLKTLKIKGGLENIQTGIEINYTEHEEFARNIHKYKMFSRINSYHKNIILKQLKERGTNIMIFLDNMTHIPLMKFSCLYVGVGKNLTNMIKKLCNIYIEDKYFHNMLWIIKRYKFLEKGKNYIQKFLLSITPISTIMVYIYISYFKEQYLAISYLMTLIIPITFSLRMFYKENKLFSVISNVVLALILLSTIGLIYFTTKQVNLIIFFVIYFTINLHLYKKSIK